MSQNYRLSFKTVNADAKLISQIGHAHGFHEVHSSNNDYNLMWTGVHPKPQNFKEGFTHLYSQFLSLRLLLAHLVVKFRVFENEIFSR